MAFVHQALEMGKFLHDEIPLTQPRIRPSFPACNRYGNRTAINLQTNALLLTVAFVGWLYREIEW